MSKKQNIEKNQMQHIGVMTDEVINALSPKDGGVYVDATLGAAGHTKQIIEQMRSGNLIVFDIDEHALNNLSRQVDILLKAKPTLVVDMVNQNFNNLVQVLARLECIPVDGIIADLGWSTDQLTHVPGLSFEDGSKTLDMRMNTKEGVTASEILNTSSPDDLKQIFQHFADFHHRELDQLVSRIVFERQRLPKGLVTVSDLNKAVANVKSNRQHNLLKRVYQALRSKVNKEKENLQQLIHQAISVLKPEGKLLIITFHSGEEQVVRSEMEKLESASDAKFMWPDYYKQPSITELRTNFKSHSAKLWGIIKT